MQTAMQKLISQIKEEMTIDTIPKEWYYCLKSVIMSIEATYLEMEKQQIIKTGLDCGSFIETEDMEQYYNETYGSKGSDDINPLTSNHVDYQNHSNLSDNFKQFSLYEHKETITSADTITSSQTEISDEEIVQKALEVGFTKTLFINGAKWYREQLKQR